MANGVLRFADFELDHGRCQLRRGNRVLKLEKIPMDLLMLLVEANGQLVTRGQIVDRIWGKDVFLDTEHGINTAIRKVRLALRDDPENPRFVETVTGRGYRFVAPLTHAPSSGNGSARGAADASSAELNASPPTAAPSTARVAADASSAEQIAQTKKPAPRWLLAALACVLAVFLLNLVLKPSMLRSLVSPAKTDLHIQSLAVLPLENLSGDPSQEYFADGMTEVLTTELGKISGVRVISRTSAMRYKGTKKSLADIARDLHADALVEGTIARSGDHVRITASLLQASPERHLWAQSYESQVGDTNAIQEQIAAAVAREIQVTLTPLEREALAASRRASPEAQDLYFRGRYTWGEGTAESAKKSVDYFQQAIQKDPNYAAAYAGMAEVYATWFPGLDRPRDRMPKAREFAQKALELDNTLADAHSVLGSVELLYDWDWTAAEEEFKQTMRFNPNHAEAYHWHSRALVTRGQTEQGVAEATKSLTLDPSPYSWDYAVWVFVLAGQYDLAAARARELANLAPNYPWPHFELALICERQGKLQEAAEESLNADTLFGTNPQNIAQLKDALAKFGPQGYWKRTLANYEKSAKSGYVPSVMTAEACMRVGDQECALTWLDRGFEERDDLMINLNVNHVFDPLRSDPRFQDLVRRVGIPH